MTDWISEIASKQPALTEHDRQMRDDFVGQYMLDFDPVDAVIRLGYNESYANHMAKQFMMDTYVLNLIVLRKRQSCTPEANDPAAMQALIKNELVAMVQHKGYGASAAAKLGALRLLAEIEGLVGSGKNKLKVEDGDNSGGVMQVPYFADSESWEQHAIKTQHDLVSSNV